MQLKPQSENQLRHQLGAQLHDQLRDQEKNAVIKISIYSTS